MQQRPPYGYPVAGAGAPATGQQQGDKKLANGAVDGTGGTMPYGYPSTRPGYVPPQGNRQSQPITGMPPAQSTAPITGGSMGAYGYPTMPSQLQAHGGVGTLQYIPQPNPMPRPAAQQMQNAAIPPQMPIANASPPMPSPVASYATQTTAYPTQRQSGAQQHSPPPPPAVHMPSVPVPSQPTQSAPIPQQQAPVRHMLPPTGIEKLANQMQNLTTTTAQPAPHMAGQPVGIIGQPLPIGQIQKFTASPIQPTLDPAFTRITLNKIPRTAAVLYKTKLPFGITVCPYPHQIDDSKVPVIDGPIVRCRRCRTYLNPYVQILDQGIKWKCNLCFLDNECTNNLCIESSFSPCFVCACVVPPNYDYDPITQKYVDRNSKAELNYPVYDFIAPMEYMVRPPQPPVYLFLLDVSYNSVASGLCSTASKIIANILDGIPNTQGRTKVGLMTVDSTVHFYQITPVPSDEPKMMVVADLEDPFLPCADDLLVNLSEGRASFEKALKKISSLFANTQISSSALGPALSAATKLLAPIGGKIILIQATLPTLGEGKLTPRDDSKLYGGSKESGLLQPTTSYYKTVATECQRVQVCVDMFLFPKPYLDIATIGCVARFTGGHVYMYEGWDAQSMEAVEKFAGDLTDLLHTEIGLEAVIRIRASQGINLGSYHGSFFLRSADLLSLPNVNRRHAYSAQVSIEENITSQLACFQTAVLHTSCQGERRIRVLNAAYPVTDDPREIFAHADVGAISDLLLKMAAEKVTSNRLEDARDALVNKITDVLGAIKTIYQTGQNPQLLLPESLRLLPLMILAILKSPPIRAGAGTSADLRSFYLAFVKTLSVGESLSLLHPFMFALHSMPDECGVVTDEQGELVMPPALNLSSEVLERHGFYILDNGQDFYMWLGSQVHPELVQLVFGQPPQGLATGRITLPTLDNPWSRRLAAIMTARRRQNGGNPSCWLAKEDGDVVRKTLFLQHLIEDKGMDGQPSYTTWATTLRDKIYSNSR